jgi:hemolysin III
MRQKVFHMGLGMHAVEKSPIPSNRAQTVGEEWANSVSHGIGFIVALIAAPLLLVAAFNRGNGGFLIGAIVFTAATLLVYFASALYHAFPHNRGKAMLQLLDHAAIFLLIAGTYTPFALGPLRGRTGFIILGLVWALAIIGVTLKILHGPERYTRFALALYLGMGWLGLIFLREFAAVVPFSAILWLIAGGLAYTMGVVFFVREHARYNHFIWHLFVLGGTTCHFCAVFSCTV